MNEETLHTEDVTRRAEEEMRHMENGALLAEEESVCTEEDNLSTEDDAPPAEKKSRRGKKERTPAQKKRRRMIWFSLLGLFVLAVIACAIFLYPIFFDPTSVFESPQIIEEKTPPEKQSGLYVPTETAVPAESPTPAPTLPEDKVNILLIGIDDEDKTYSADYHTDTMIVLSVNFKTGKVDMISLRRDTFARIPGVRGFYKLNAAINVGGGMYAENNAGFLKVCEAAEWMLGGISIDYFYALQIPALIEIVDLIGGVDYDVDLSIGHIKRGFQHLTGGEVMVYMRARKEMRSGDEGDIYRVQRQKNMLLAIFSKLKEQNMLSIFPELVSTVKHGVFTNTTMQQTLTLLNWARTLDIDSIGLYSMDGPMVTSLDWSFCFPDQAKRVKLIKEVYGVDVPEITNAGSHTTLWLSRRGMRALKHLANADMIYEYALETWDATLTAEQQELIDKLSAQYTHLTDSYHAAEASPRLTALNDTMDRACTTLRWAVEAVAKECGYTRNFRWYPLPDWTMDKDINEISVDFR